MRYLAVDLGARRTGLAVGDDTTGIATPVRVVESGGPERVLREVARAAAEHLGDSGVIVVGLPLNMDGTEGPAARAARRFAERVAVATGRVVRLHDERLTTADADWSLAGSGLTREGKKRRRDAVAAAAMLRDFLAQRAAGPGADGPDGDAEGGRRDAG